MGKRKAGKAGDSIAERLGALAEVAIEAAAADGAGLSGRRRKRLAVRRLAESLDAELTFGPGPIGRLAEVVDSHVIALLGALVQSQFEKMRDGGKI